jgi:hypothetical protein
MTETGFAEYRSFGLSQNGDCTDLFENLCVNSLKEDLANATPFNPPLFSLSFLASLLQSKRPICYVISYLLQRGGVGEHGDEAGEAGGRHHVSTQLPRPSVLQGE